MFELKKIVSAFLMPLPAMLLIGLAGLLLLWFSRRKGLGTGLVSIAFLGIFLFSFQPVSTSLLRPVEKAYPPYVPSGKPVEFVMVLGSGHIIDNAMPITSQLSRTALMRLSEGIRIHRMFPGSKLILSGFSGGTEVSQARMMAQVALALGVNKHDILLLETARDTKEEASQAATVVGDHKLVLVTSASHMSRALNEFHSEGLTPIPAPTNFLASNKIEQPWERYKPQALYLEQTERYWHEQLGRWWQTLRSLLNQQNETAEESHNDAVNAG
ncbi:envelope biogenesis factor ElyC [Photobacterium ganghwense]|uniref:Membrane protein n=1 Tax=Photobacterium ganghwense TaxID=320778 RepID=A0A0J1HGU4_9GAMM|nr:envelope biogenesis factor ElyC [Photobacterium ganghwense]KLV10825.1 membrane protein [Photobacterium ganghwense]MBV1840695.1 envelope biogenesis factor ElyC [Photobacterium ganghwense]PSU10999.1 envelope biogenesis factor ElyC [Photobacterium ganghwense]